MFRFWGCHRVDLFFCDHKSRMGQFFSRKYWFGKREVKIYIQGVYNAGKASILHKLNLGDVKDVMTTIGFNVETVSYKNITFTSWDLGGRCSFRPLARHYYAQGVDAVVFVVDSCDTDLFEMVRCEISRLLHEDDLKEATFLVLANKQDVPGALGVREVAERLDFLELTRNHNANIIGCSAKTGDGLHDAMDILANAIRSKTKPDPNQRNGRNSDKFLMTEKEKTTWSIPLCFKASLEFVKTLIPK